MLLIESPAALTSNEAIDEAHSFGDSRSPVEEDEGRVAEETLALAFSAF